MTMHEHGSFVVKVESRDGNVIVAPQGDVDLACSPELRYELQQAAQKKPKRLIVDLAGVPYMDSSGVATLLEALQRVQGTGSSLVLCSMPEKVRAIFQIARLEMVFCIVENVEAALAE